MLLTMDRTAKTIMNIAKDVCIYKLTKNYHKLVLHRTMATRLTRCHRLLPDFKTTVRWLCADHNFNSVSSARPRTESHFQYDRRVNYLCKCIRVYSTKPNNQKIVIDASPRVAVLEKTVLPVLNDSLPTLEKKSTRSDDVALWKRAWEASDPYVKLARMDKPIGTWLLFWPCSWSIALAGVHGGLPPEQCLHNLALFLVGSFVMRGAGCTINDLWDRDIDKKVARTKDRPLVSGALSERRALVFLAAQLSAGLAVLLQLNWYSVFLGASSMALVITYPLAKRFTDYPQVFLGATFNWGALLGWSAQLGELSAAVCLPLYGGALCWSVLYDTIYAHQDKEDDARIGMKSTALTFGAHTRPLLAAFGAATLTGVALAGHAVRLDWPYYAALAVVGVHVARQIYTLQPDNPSDCASKFKSNSLVGLIIFLGVVAGGWRQYADKRRQQRAGSQQRQTLA